MKDQGLTVLLVDLWEKHARVAKTVADRGYAMRVVIDPDGTVSNAYRVSRTPTVYLVGKDGTLVGWAIGPRPWTEPVGRALLDALLKSPGTKTSEVR
jgi:AhpC/TSA family protein